MSGSCPEARDGQMRAELSIYHAICVPTPVGEPATPHRVADGEELRHPERLHVEPLLLHVEPVEVVDVVWASGQAASRSKGRPRTHLGSSQRSWWRWLG